MYVVNGSNRFGLLKDAISFVQATILVEPHFKTLSAKELEHAALEWIVEDSTEQTLGLEGKHAHMVSVLAKPGGNIIADLTPEGAHLLHMAVGVSGESGELLDAIKKATIYSKPIDRENVVEELGDLEFYMEGLRNKLGITREETLTHNMAKLAKRYNGAYSNQAAQVRADKVEEAQAA